MKKLALNFLYVLTAAILASSCAKDIDLGRYKPSGGGDDTTVTTPWPSPAGDVVGKITVGYQGWFACDGDGGPSDTKWWHWAGNWGQAPSLTNTAIISWPDVRDYTNTYATAYPNLGSGDPAKLFSDYDAQTVDVQFSWMQQYDLDVAALQRFNPNGIEGPVRDAVTAKVKTSAEKYGRKFYIMYDVTQWTNMQTEIKADWTNKMKQYTSSSAYAMQNGKPVVCIWGFGFNDDNHPWTPDVCLDVIQWFKDQGCYVIGGVPTHWRDQNSDSKAGFINVYKAFNMLSPWMVGRMSKPIDSDNFYTQTNVPDVAFCKANGIDYQPCVLPGTLQDKQRAHGDFMWRQFYNMTRAGSQGIYISMFDEYNEGNQIAKTAENASMIPAGSGILGLDEDGTACSSDYYMRLTQDGRKMFLGTIGLTATRPTKPMP
ncbi:glycoside hydrolase family 71/99-like protein [Ferruginibacter albus]|uniref:glycoside hydrolase family 71/99-like protein n=1 Tax=Ferruginibacter albus TaxID=2875540 RepID=UPI001CC5FEF2|nr:glycoside hydrolase family 71/99-like protein [Ferruginibacter albus]UAY50840.1 xylosidase [Ferruginibacter albus]